MIGCQIGKLPMTEPFRPFDVDLANGRFVHVPHPDFDNVPPQETRLTPLVSRRLTT